MWRQTGDDGVQTYRMSLAATQKTAASGSGSGETRSVYHSADIHAACKLQADWTRLLGIIDERRLIRWTGGGLIDAK